jgi:hypothetical protein
MTFKQDILTAAIETARKAANDNRALLNAIEKAAIGLRGAWVVTELASALVVTTESGETYFANGSCGCAAYRNGMVCKHRVAYRIVAIYHELETAPAEAPAPVRRPTITRSVESDHTGVRVVAVRCNNWLV